MTVGQQLLSGCEITQRHIALRGITKSESLQRRDPVMEKFGISLIVGIELVDDIDCLRSHSQPPHEIVIGRHLLGLQSGAVDQIEELHPEQNFPIVAELAGELRRHCSEILLLFQRLPEKLAELGVNRLRIVVAQKAKTRVNLLLQHFPIDPGKGRQHLNQRREQIGALGDCLGLAADSAPALG